MDKTLTPKVCRECPFEYDTIACTHPDGPDSLNWLSDEEPFDVHDRVHPECPLRRKVALVCLSGEAVTR
jgi:hypothetical protein